MHIFEGEYIGFVFVVAFLCGNAKELQGRVHFQADRRRGRGKERGGEGEEGEGSNDGCNVKVLLVANLAYCLRECVEWYCDESS